MLKGYTGEISAAIAGSALLLLGIVSLVLYRNWRYEQELDSLLWKVDFKEIQMHENDKDGNNHKQTRVEICHSNSFYMTIYIVFLLNFYSQRIHLFVLVK